MPLDGHSFLVSQGWSGKGSGLRQGAIAKPLAIPQKKNLSGLGKDRDEAFPFWDHLFTAAASTIKIKVDSEDDQDTECLSAAVFKRTSTGILSNRRPTSGTIADSGTATPESDTPRLSLMAHAKREAAKRGLYSKFFRGPILGPHEVESVAESSSLAPKGTIELEILKRKLEKTVNGEERTKRKHRRKLASEGSKLRVEKKEKKGRGSHECSLEDSKGKKAKKARRREKQETKGQAEVAPIVTTPMESKEGEQGWVAPVNDVGKSNKKRRNRSPQSRSTPDGNANHKKRNRKDP